MGCWNGTCMISNLPILSGEEVKLVILTSHKDTVKITNTTGYYYSTDLLTPAFFPITGIYNDYGMIEDIQKDWAYDLTLSILKKTYEVIEVEKKEIVDFDLEHILEGIERGTLKVCEKNDTFKPSPFSFVMIRKDIWDGIVQNTKHNLSYWNDKRKDNDDYYIDSVTYITRKLEKLNEYIERYKILFGNDFNKDLIDSSLFFSYEERFFNKPMHLNYIMDNMDVVKNDIIEFTLIKTFLEYTRKGWMIHPGLGSQSSDINPYLLLCDLVKEVSSKFEVEDY